jgi:hypothetical protein
MQLAATTLTASENLSPDELRSMVEHYIRLCNERNVKLGGNKLCRLYVYERGKQKNKSHLLFVIKKIKILFVHCCL